MIHLRIEQWRAWAPGLDTSSAWQTWAQAPHVVPDQQEQPECLSLPPMQRRRLSRLARMTMEVASPLCGEDEQLPFVFASRHGETTRTFALLGDVTDEQPLSPTQFGLSVHNAIAGQWSILRGQRGESVAIAGEADTFEHALVEASTHLAAGAASVLVVIAEEMPPSAYTQWIDDVPFSYALALRLGSAASSESSSTDACWELQLERHDSHGAPCAWPHALDFLRALQTDQTSLEHVWKTRRWKWQRTR
ncbi:beta-ketoacyl synthase chain length factor [Rhodanobacter sp. L36]|uniref:beta-ketoacyl synthase chain length factor n=1 Tax=Rhodanobacter sp. L36 TaxID=1747221 RepID=UPI00131C19BD|nr:beta-ketoacyl synthase chain length factor [Rhodanobacter sp. L36]